MTSGGAPPASLWALRRGMAAASARALRRGALILMACACLMPAVASGAEVFDDWRDGDLVAQNRPGSREASLWSATGSRYNHVGIVRLTGGGPYVLDLTGSASEVPVEDYIARGTGAGYAIYRVSGLSHRLGAGAAEAAWQNSDRPRDDFIASDPAKLTDTGLVHRAFEAVGVNVGLSRKVGDLRIPRSRLWNVMKRDWKKNPTCSSVETNAASCLKAMLSRTVITMTSVLNDRKISKIYESLGEAIRPTGHHGPPAQGRAAPADAGQGGG